MTSLRWTRKSPRSLAAAYPRSVRWRDEDGVFIGGIEGLCGDRDHGGDPVVVFRTLKRLAGETIAQWDALGLALPGSSVANPDGSRSRQHPERSRHGGLEGGRQMERIQAPGNGRPATTRPGPFSRRRCRWFPASFMPGWKSPWVKTAWIITGANGSHTPAYQVRRPPPS